MLYGVNLKTVASIMRVNKTTGRVSRRETKNRSATVLTEDIKIKIRKLIEENVCITLREIKTKLNDE